MSVSVLLAVHDGAQWLNQAIDSVRAQTLQDWELIVVLNGCSDGSERIAAAAAQHDRRIQVITLVEKGKNNAYNEAYRRATRDCICFFACDDLLTVDSLEKRSAPILRQPELFTTCLMRISSTDRRYDGIQMPRRREDPNYSGGCLMFSRFLADRIFPLPLCYPNEDTWVQLHLRLFGRLVHLPDVLYIYRIHANNSFGNDKSFSEKRSAFLARMCCYTDVHALYADVCAESRFYREVLSPYVEGVRLCEGRDIVRIFCVSGLPFPQKLVLAGYCNPVLFWFRRKFGRLFTGRFGQG